VVEALLVLVAAASAIGALGIAIGRRLAPALTQWSEREAEDADGEC
jgi:hypothetical protein